MRFAKRLAFATVATGAVLWGTTDDARAGILINVMEVGGTGGSNSSNTPGNTGVFNFTVGDYQGEVDVGTTNFPGTTFGILTTTTNTTLVGPLTGALIVTVTVVNDGTMTPATFLNPAGTALNLHSEIRSTGVSTGTIDFYSVSNGAFSPTTAPGTPLTVTIPSGVVSSDAPVVGGPGYTLSNTTILHLNVADASIGSTGTSTVTATATPEPSTVLIALSALPLLGLRSWVRRRRSRA